MSGGLCWLKLQHGLDPDETDVVAVNAQIGLPGLLNRWSARLCMGHGRMTSGLRSGGS